MTPAMAAVIVNTMIWKGIYYPCESQCDKSLNDDVMLNSASSATKTNKKFAIVQALS